MRATKRYMVTFDGFAQGSEEEIRERKIPFIVEELPARSFDSFDVVITDDFVKKHGVMDLIGYRRIAAGAVKNFLRGEMMGLTRQELGPILVGWRYAQVDIVTKYKRFFVPLHRL